MGIFIQNIELLKNYKYQGEDRSIVTKYFLKPYWWTTFVKIFPSWFAPNAVTLSGFGFIIINLITCLYYDPYLNDPTVPTWTTVSYAIGLFLYQTFDACDGMQARKTGQSGPLGELFDHCVDAMNTSLSVIIFASVTKMGYSWMFIISQFGVLANFYLSTWEEYHTHILFLSEFSGPVEGILMIILLYLATAYFGNEIWLATWYKMTFTVLGKELSFDIGCNAIYIVLGAIQLYFNIISAYNNVLRIFSKDDKPDARKRSNVATRGLIPFMVYYGLVFAFLFVAQPYIFTNSSSFLPFVLQIGTSMAFTVGRIIVSHLTLSEFPFHLPTIYIILGQVIILSIGKLQSSDLSSLVNILAWSGFGLSLGIHGCFIAEIIYEICEYLDIWVLTIKHPKKLK